jgi:hypothetical protein
MIETLFTLGCALTVGILLEQAVFAVISKWHGEVEVIEKRQM